MKIIWLVWYLSAVFFLLTLSTMGDVYTSDMKQFEGIVPIVFASLAICLSVVAVALNVLPATHRLRESKPRWAGFVAIGITFVLIVGLLG
jgi:hypothetical protein